MVTYLADPAFVRKLMGSPTDGTGGTPAEITSSEMDEILEDAHDQLVLFTKKSDWSPADPIYNQLKMIEALFASSIGRSIWRDPDNKAQEHYNRGKNLCTAIMENQEMSSAIPPQGASYTAQTYQYRTAALNPEARRYRSPRVDV